MSRILFRSLTRSVALFSVLLFGLSTTQARAQTGDDALRFFQRSPGVGPVGLGMGGAGIAGVGDLSALVLNPAGLALTRSSIIMGSFASSDFRDESHFVVPGAEFAGETDLQKTGLGSIGSLYKVPTTRGSLVLGIAFNQVSTYNRDLYFDGENGSNSITDFFMPLSDEFELLDDGDGLYPDFFRPLSFIAYETYGIDFDQGLYDAGDPVPFLPAVSAGTVAQYGSVLEEGRLGELNFGAAFEAARDVMFGASVNIPFSRYTYNRRFEEEDIFNDNDGSGGTTDFAYLDFVEWFESDIVGINARLGVSALVTPGFRLGAMIETPTISTIEEDYETILYTEFDNGDAFEYGDESTEDALSGFFEYEVITPWRAGAGISYRTSALTLFADAEWVDWSQLEFQSDDYSFADENRAIQEAYEQVVNASVGASYDTGNFTIRAGAAVRPDPRDERFLDDPDGSDIDRDRKFFSLGFGYRISEEFRIDAGWMQERFDDLYRPYTEVAGAPFVVEEIVRNRFQLGLTLFI